MGFYAQLGWYFRVPKKFIELAALWYFDIECKLMAHMRTWHCTAQKSIIYSPLRMYQFYWFLSTMNLRSTHRTFFFCCCKIFCNMKNIIKFLLFFISVILIFLHPKLKQKKNTKIKNFADFRSFWFHIKNNDKKIKSRLLRK